MSLKCVMLWSLFYVTFCYVDPIQVITDLSSTVGGYVIDCYDATRFPEIIIKEFLSYWSEDIPLVDPALGCVVVWVLEKMELMEANGTLKMENAKAFLMAKDSDELTSETLIKLYNLCVHSIDLRPDVKRCGFGLVMAQCFRHGILMLDWIPAPTAPSSPEHEEMVYQDDFEYA